MPYDIWYRTGPLRLILADNYATAEQAAIDLYNAECDALGCETPEEEERVSKRDAPVLMNAVTGEYATLVPAKATPDMLAAMAVRQQSLPLLEGKPPPAPKVIGVDPSDDASWQLVFAAPNPPTPE